MALDSTLSAAEVLRARALALMNGDGDMRFLDADEAASLAMPDVYFCGSYGRLYCSSNDQWRCLVWRGTVVLPLIVRPVPETLATKPDKTSPQLFDAVTPYGYTGAVALDGAPEPDWDAFWQAAVAFLHDRRIVCAFLRCCPYMRTSYAAPLAAGVKFVQRTTFSIDMIGIDSVNAFLRQSRKGFKCAYSKGRRALLEVKFVEMTDIAVFRDMYEALMTESLASDFYHFPASYYADLHAALGRDVMQLHVCAPDGQVVAATLLMRHGRKLHYHLSCASPRGKKLSATNYMWGFIVDYAIREGITMIHLGGGVHEGDSLDKFKRSFSNTQHAYFLGQWVADPVAFAQLNAERARQEGLAVLPPSTWFPPYRMKL